jgi:hypothetical protein
MGLLQNAKKASLRGQSPKQSRRKTKSRLLRFEQPLLLAQTRNNPNMQQAL